MIMTKIISQYVFTVILQIWLICLLTAAALSQTPVETSKKVSQSLQSECGKTTVKPGNWHEMIYHEKLKKVILVNGGPEQGKSPNDPLELWEWNGVCWSLLNPEPNAPRWRNFAATAYDSKRGVLVLYGGLQNPSVQFEETWEWDGKIWKRIEAKGPGVREVPGMTFDAKRNQTLLFGGAQGDTIKGDTWAWDGKVWKSVSESGPASRFPAGFVYDATRELTLLFGGHRFSQSGIETFGDTWSWDGKIWKQYSTPNAPARRDGGRAVFDTRRKQIVLFGGIEIGASVNYFDDTWIWKDSSWTEIKAAAPLGRGHHSMAYDAERDRVIVFGGARKMGEILNDTWEWDGQQWKCLDGCKN